MRVSAILLALVSAGTLALAAREDTQTTDGSFGNSFSFAPEAVNSGGVLGAVTKFFDKSVPRGIRNNNPGNIRISGANWQGKVTGPDTAFEAFKTPEDGIRAAGKLLVNYQKLYGLNTLSAILSRYAPNSENDTRAYVDAVSRSIGIGPNVPFDVFAALPKLLPAIIKHENGVQPYTDAQIAAAIKRI